MDLLAEPVKTQFRAISHAFSNYANKPLSHLCLVVTKERISPKACVDHLKHAGTDNYTVKPIQHGSNTF